MDERGGCVSRDLVADNDVNLQTTGGGWAVRGGGTGFNSAGANGWQTSNESDFDILASGFSVVVDVYVNTLPSQYRAIVAKWNDQAVANRSVFCGVKNTNRFGMVTSTDGSYSAGRDFDSGVNITAGQEYHVAYTYDVNAGGKIYINGILASSNASSGTLFNTPEPLKFQRVSVAAPNAVLDCVVGRVLIYSRAIPIQQVRQLYEEPYCMLQRSFSLAGSVSVSRIHFPANFYGGIYDHFNGGIAQ